MSAKYTTVDAVKSARGPGTRDSDTLTSMFVTPTELTSYILDPYKHKLFGMALLLDGIPNEENTQVGSFSRDYLGAPSYDDVAANIAAGAVAGPPASPWVPNPSSPGPGSINPLDELLPDAPTTGIYDSDPGKVIVPNGSNADSVITPKRNPATSSSRMSKTEDYTPVLGDSPATVNSGG